jgi:predicted PurR-regulated permease PerM
MQAVEEKTFLLLILIISLAFLWVLGPYFGPIMWGVVCALLFEPLHNRLLVRWPGRTNRAALLTLLAIIAIVVIPAIILTVFLMQEITSVYAMIRSGQINFAHYFQQFQSILPNWASGMLDRWGLSDFAAVQAKLVNGITSSFQSLAAKAVTIGQSFFGFTLAIGIMLYLTFFLIRDGKQLASTIDRAVPLRRDHWNALVGKFVTVVRATIKGSVVVAVVQGLIGGVAFWALGIHAPVLWGVAMGFLSLLPAIGTGLVWVPVAAYLLASGDIWQGVVLVLVGVFVIGMVDNILRPLLVGRDTRMPDYVVLISTLGGIEVFGFSGFVIGPVVAALFMAVWAIFAETRALDSGTPADIS